MKWLKTSVVLGVGVAVLLTSHGLSQASSRKGNLYKDLSKQGAVATFVVTPENFSDDDRLSMDDLKLKLQEALSNRKSIHFEIVQEMTDADIRIECKIHEFFWSETDPVDMFLGTGPLILDAAKNDHYAQMKATFSIVNQESGRILWIEKLRASVTNETMTPEESIPMVHDKMVKVFIREAFSRKRS